MDIKKDTPIIVFAQSASERDFLRRILGRNDRHILYFENEAICFDNLKTIVPQAIVLRTDSRGVAWRFIFALHALQLDARLLIVSNFIAADHFSLQGLSLTILCLPLKIQEEILSRLIEQCISRQDDAASILSTELLVGETQLIKTINSKLPCLAHSPDPVLITGEPGTGKELLARLIVQCAGRPTMFIKLDCETIERESLFERLLGKCAYASACKCLSEEPSTTDAINILLHNIDCLDEEAQSEILMLLDGGTGRMMFPGRSVEQAGVRVIATAKENLFYLVERGIFRKDLFYRLNVIPLHLPPLRERNKDLTLLMDYFIISACIKMKRSFMIPTAASKSRMLAHLWPGNLDELKRAIDRFALSGDEAHLYAHIGDVPPGNQDLKHISRLFELATLPDTLEIQNCFNGSEQLSLKLIGDRFACRTEKKLMQKALETTNWNRRKAAALLNISYKSMLNKMKIYEIV